MRTYRLVSLALLGVAAAAGACKETVVNVLPVANVQVTGSGGTLLIGQSVQLAASPRDDRNTALANRSVSWSSSNAGVASVSGTGMVQAVGAGSATITAAVEGVSGTLALNVNNPAPSISSLSPASVAIGSAAFQLTVLGTGFVSNSVVVWNGQDRPTTYVDAGTLKASITAADVASAGSFNVTVRNPQPGGGTSSAQALPVINPVPILTSLSPATVLYGGATFQLTLTGTGFLPTSVARWKGQDRATTYVSATTLKINVAAADIAAPTLIDVTVANPTPGGGASAASQFVVRIPVPGSTISARGYSTCAVRGNGDTYCWGQNYYGQLGDGSTTERAVPTRVATTLPFLSVVASNYHGCGLTSWGAAYCWGMSPYIGAGTASSLTPAAVSGGLTFVQLAAGSTHTCGVTAAGALYCWGDNYYGQIGDGTTSSRNTPVPVGAGLTWRRVIAGGRHTCALTTDGRMYCWGYNYFGQLGDGTTTSHSTPAPISGNLVFSSGAAGDQHVCGITAGGAAYCWGMGGKLGNGAATNSSTPVAVNGGASFVVLAAGTNQTCGVTQAGLAYCWGSGDSGQIGDGQLGWDYSPVSVNVPALRDIAAGQTHSCGITSTGAVYCWGERAFGALGDGQSDVRTSPTAVAGASSGYAAVTVGQQISCGLNGTSALCWGHNSMGQMGDGTSTDHLVPGTVSGGYSFSQVSAGWDHACGRTAAGAVYCWGSNNRGQLGNGSTSNASAPSPVSGGYTFTDISAGISHSCGVTTAGSVMCWGFNRNGELGDGTTSMRTTPTEVPVFGQVFTKVSAGYYFTCAVTRGNRVYCWGWNVDGQLGDGTTTDRLSPVLTNIPSTVTVTQVSAGTFSACAATQEGPAYCWGFNGVGELGTGNSSSTPVTTPTQVSGGLNWRKIVEGYQTTCGITMGTSVAYCWGLNDWGRAGTGGLYGYNVPTVIQGGGTYADISTRFEHTCAVTTAGAVFCWGHTRFGELGLGLAGIIPSPAPVSGGIVFDPPTGTTLSVARYSRSPLTPSVMPVRLLPRLEPSQSPETCAEASQLCPLTPVRLVR